MDYINSYVRAKKFFFGKICPWTKKSNTDFNRLRDEIQKETTLQKFGCVGYLSVGLISGAVGFVLLLAAPMTAGLSTAMAIACYGGMTWFRRYCPQKL